MGNILLVSSIFIPFFGAIATFIWGSKFKKSVSLLACFISALTFLIIIGQYILFNQGETLRIGFNVGLPFDLALKADGLGIFLSLITTSIWFLVSIYSIDYIQDRKGIYAAFMLLSLYGMLGITLSENLFTLLLFFEIFSVSSAILVIHKLTDEAIRAGFQYLFISVVGTVCLIAGAAILFSKTGSLDIAGTGLSGLTITGLGAVAFWLMIIGFAVKAGLFPLHVAMPQAYPVAPSAAVALLSGVMTKAGAFGIIRIVYGVYGHKLAADTNTTGILLGLAVFTLIIGSVFAVTQNNLKRMLAYSSIAQIGYIVLGTTLLSQRGLAGAGLAILNHALGKSALFLAAGAIIYKTGIRDIDKLSGIAKRMPFTMIVFTFAAFSIIGIPPFLGFASKWYLAQGAMQAFRNGFIGMNMSLVIVGSLIISTILNLLYFIPIIAKGWFGVPHTKLTKLAVVSGGSSAASHSVPEEIKLPLTEVSLKMAIPMAILALSVLFLGTNVSLPLKLINKFILFYFKG